MTDPNNFEVFMRKYQDMVFSTAVRLLGNEADAQDIAQAVFLKAYDNYSQIGESPTVGGWLKTVATNLSLNHLSRYRARWRFFSELRSEDREDDFVEGLPAPDRLEQELADADHRRLLEEALRRLPTAQRVPLVLFHFESQGYEEIAATLKVSLSKVKTDIHRGRQALARYLKPSLLGEERWGNKPGPETKTDKTPNPKTAKRDPAPPSLFTLHTSRLTSYATGD